MIKIFATDDKGNREEINDLYWFEERGIHGWDGDSLMSGKYTFEIFIDDIKVFAT